LKYKCTDQGKHGENQEAWSTLKFDQVLAARYKWPTFCLDNFHRCRRVCRVLLTASSGVACLYRRGLWGMSESQHLAANTASVPTTIPCFQTYGCRHTCNGALRIWLVRGVVLPPFTRADVGTKYGLSYTFVINLYCCCYVHRWCMRALLSGRAIVSGGPYLRRHGSAIHMVN
jgi:hypothetical protein